MTDKIKIFQAYYRDDQKEFLSPEFEPYDNRSNPVKNLYEHYIYHQVRDIAKEQGLEKWGVVSWQWHKKLQGISAAAMLDIAGRADNTADVTLFNAYPNDEATCYSMWEQGVWSHPYILHLGRACLTAMGEDPNLVYYPMAADTYLAANYFVGTADFWDGLLEFLDRYVVAIDNLSEEDTIMLRTSAGYGPNPNLDYTGFICERLISTYLIKRKIEGNITTGAFVPHSDSLSTLKYQAVEEWNKEKMLEWNEKRPLRDGPKIATEWIEKLF